MQGDEKQITEHLVNQAKQRNCRTAKDVHSFILSELIEHCKRKKKKISKMFLSAIADDWAETICLQLNIDN